MIADIDSRRLLQRLGRDGASMEKW